MRVGRDVVTGSGLVRPRRRAAAGGFEEVHPFGLAVPGFGQVQGDVAAAVACGPRRDVECAQQRVFDRLLGVSTNGVVYTNGSAFVVGGNNCAYGGCQWLSVAVSGCQWLSVAAACPQGSFSTIFRGLRGSWFKKGEVPAHCRASSLYKSDRR
jgi:hypothetical protein